MSKILNLRVEARNDYSAIVRWEDKDGFEYNFVLDSEVNEDRSRSIVRPFRIETTKKQYGGMDGQWINKHLPRNEHRIGSRVSKLNANSKTWAPVVKDIIDRITGEWLVDSAHMTLKADTEAKAEKAAAEREEKIRAGLREFSEDQVQDVRMAARILSEHCTREQLFALSLAVRYI